jgi:hypothetical protein
VPPPATPKLERAADREPQAPPQGFQDFSELEEFARLRNKQREALKQRARGRERSQTKAREGPGNFPEQEWTYKDVKDPPVRACAAARRTAASAAPAV